VPIVPKDSKRKQPVSPSNAPQDTISGEAKTDADTAPINTETNNNEVTEPPDIKSDDINPDVSDIPVDTIENSFDSVENKEKPAAEHGSERSRTKKTGKLRFDEDAAAPAESGTAVIKPDSQPPIGKKLEKAQNKADLSSGKLEKARKKLPKKRHIKIERTFDDASNKPKRRLAFDDEVKSQHAHLRGSPVTRPFKTGVRNIGRLAHTKVFQVEHENDAVKAAHRAEMYAEAGLRTAYRFHKTSPYRRVQRLEAKTAKLHMKASYQKALNDNPKLKSNIFSRMAQKRKIKRQYAKAAREAKKAGRTARKTGDILVKAGQAAVRAVARHPIVFAVIGIALLLFFIIASLFTACSSMGSGVGSSFAMVSYLAEDEAIDNASIIYTEWETDLRLQIINAESDWAGYDEYRYNIDNIGHSPLELMAFLTAVYQDFSYDDIEAVLQEIFAEQYQLAFTPSVEIRYYYDDEGNLISYDWHVLTVTLTSLPFTDVISAHMNTDQLQHFLLLNMSRGNRQYSGSPFGFNWLPYVTSYYGYRVHPITGAKDLHRGIDIAVPLGTDIRAGNIGTVSVGYDADGYGHYIVVTGADGLITKYAHLDSVLVSDGQTVAAGYIIGKSGDSGQSTGPHLHFEIVSGEQYLNPIYFAFSP
jgi:murein DD-endopeptidase MepM/ murein hydrolase activator NlpD